MARVSRSFLLVSLVVLALFPADAAGEMAVTDSGVGGGVVDRELRDRGDRFDEGGEVWFWTRVSGGDGEILQHVWLRQGEVVHVEELAIGADSWRTWSQKTLHPGSVGDWAVEARDPAGRVLARHEFRCTPAAERNDQGDAS